MAEVGWLTGRARISRRGQSIRSYAAATPIGKLRYDLGCAILGKRQEIPHAHGAHANPIYHLDSPSESEFSLFPPPSFSSRSV